MADGYIKLHRQLLESYQFSNPENLKIWIWMLLKANYKKRTVSISVGNGYTDITLERGQFIFGRTSAAVELKMHESKIYRVVKRFESDRSIVIKSNNKYSIITICKYDDYNNFENEVEQQSNNRRTTGEQQVNTDNKVNKEKENIYKEFSFFNNGFEKVWGDYLKMRTTIKKPATDAAQKLALKKLETLSGNDKIVAIKIVEQSIEKSWQSFYQIKDDNTFFKNQKNYNEEYQNNLPDN